MHVHIHGHGREQQPVVHQNGASIVSLYEVMNSIWFAFNDPGKRKFWSRSRCRTMYNVQQCYWSVKLFCINNSATIYCRKLMKRSNIHFRSWHIILTIITRFDLSSRRTSKLFTLFLQQKQSISQKVHVGKAKFKTNSHHQEQENVWLTSREPHHQPLHPPLPNTHTQNCHHCQSTTTIWFSSI